MLYIAKWRNSRDLTHLSILTIIMELQYSKETKYKLLLV